MITPGGRVGDATPLGTGKRKLSDYEREVAHALMRKGVLPKSRAIAMARGIIDKAAKTGRWGHGKAKPNIIAGSVASVAQRKAFSGSNEAPRYRHGWIPIDAEHEAVAAKMTDPAEAHAALAYHDNKFISTPKRHTKIRAAHKAAAAVYKKRRTELTQQGRLFSNGGATMPHMDILLAVLDKDARDALDASEFAIPSERKYPIPDIVHARVALAFVAKNGTPAEQAQVRAAVKKKFPQLSESKSLSNPVGDLLFAEAVERGLIDLGRDGAKWRHGWIPMNGIAAAIKAKKFHGNAPSGKTRINVNANAEHALAPKGKARISAAQRARGEAGRRATMTGDIKSGKHSFADIAKNAREGKYGPDAKAAQIKHEAAQGGGVHGEAAAAMTPGRERLHAGAMARAEAAHRSGDLAKTHPKGMRAEFTHPTTGKKTEGEVVGHESRDGKPQVQVSHVYRTAGGSNGFQQTLSMNPSEVKHSKKYGSNGPQPSDKVTLKGNESYNLTTGKRVETTSVPSNGGHGDLSKKSDDELQYLHHGSRGEARTGTAAMLRERDYTYDSEQDKWTKGARTSNTSGFVKQPRKAGAAPLVGPNDFGKSPANVNATRGTKGNVNIHDSATNEKMTVNESRLASLFNGGHTVTGVKGGRLHTSSGVRTKHSFGPGLNDGRIVSGDLPAMGGPNAPLPEGRKVTAHELSTGKGEIRDAESGHIISTGHVSVRRARTVANAHNLKVEQAAVDRDNAVSRAKLEAENRKARTAGAIKTKQAKK